MIPVDRFRSPIVIGALSSILSALMAGGVAITVSQRAIASERRAQAAAAQERQRAVAASLAVVCTVIKRQEEVFQDAVSQVGRNSAAAWHDLGRLYGCYKE